MKTFEALVRIINLGLDNNDCGIVQTASAPLDTCKSNFGSFRAIIEPLPNKTYLFEWLNAEKPNQIGVPDALLVQPSLKGTVIIYLYELD